MAFNFIYSKDSDKTRTMKLFCKKIKRIRRINEWKWIFYSVDKISPNRGGSNIDSPEWKK